MSRSLNIRMKPETGTLNYFVAKLDGEVVISTFAGDEAQFTGEVPDAPVTVRLEVHGLKGAKYTAFIDLPGDEHDSKVTRTLSSKVDTFSQTI